MVNNFFSSQLNKPTFRRISLVLALFLAAFSLFSIYLIASKGQGIASAKLTVHGHGVEILKPGNSEWEKVGSATNITSGTKVRSDGQSSAEIDYQGGTATQLDISSEIIMEDQVTSPQKIAVGLVKGRVWNTIAKTKGGITYQTKSLNMSVTVYGTAYSHEILPDGRERVVVTENAVLVECLGNPDLASKQVEEGNMLTSDCASALASTEAPPDILTSATPPTDLKKETSQTGSPQTTPTPRVQGSQTQSTPQSTIDDGSGGTNNKSSPKPKDSSTPIPDSGSESSGTQSHAPPVEPQSGDFDNTPLPCPTNPQGKEIGNCKNG